MKRKKTNWNHVAWTPFEPASMPDAATAINSALHESPAIVLVNSRYQVSVYPGYMEPYGRIAHLSIKTHDKQAHHDWRDLQRIKNEICGEECDAIEIYPAESKLVDMANQYHLTVFKDWKLPFGFQTRIIADGNWGNSKQRPFEPGERPADCMNAQQYGAWLLGHIKNRPGISDDARRAALAALGATGGDDE